MHEPFPADSRIRWRRLDTPAAGFEEARVERVALPGVPGVPGLLPVVPGVPGEGWRLSGRVEVEEAGNAAALRYRIECDDAWRTRAAVIEGVAGGEKVRVALTSDGAGNWWRDGEALPHLRGATDIDLGFTPMTNTLPIRRLSLAVGETAPVRSAWLRFPELRLEPLEQTYTREAERVYRYRALVDGEAFTAQLTTDAYGRVVEYEGLWRAEELKP